MQHFYQSNLWYWWLSHPNEPYPQNLLAPITEAHGGADFSPTTDRDSSSGQSEAQAPRGKHSTPLYLLVLSKDTSKIQQALQNGADVNETYPTNGNTALHIAALNGYTDIIPLLLAWPGIDKNRKNNDGKTALDLALEHNQMQAARLLD